MKHGTTIAFAVIIVLTILFAYQYQKPVLTSGEAIMLAVEYLQEPPKEYGESIRLRTNLENLPPEEIIVSLSIKRGVLSEMMNRRVWLVTIKYDGMEPTVVMDAITGKFITIFGPVS